MDVHIHLGQVPSGQVESEAQMRLNQARRMIRLANETLNQLEVKARDGCSKVTILLGNRSFRSYSRSDPGSFRSYSLSVRSFRPGSFRPDFRGGSFRSSFGGSFRPTLFYILFR